MKIYKKWLIIRLSGIIFDVDSYIIINRGTESMNRKKENSLKKTNRMLFFTATLISLIVIAFVSVCVVNTDNLAEYVENIFTSSNNWTLGAMRVKANIQTAREEMLDIIETPERLNSAENSDNIITYKEEFDRLLDLIDGGYDEVSINELQQLGDEFLETQRRIVQLVDAGDVHGATSMYNNVAMPLYERMNQIADNIVEDSTQSLRAYVEHASELNIVTNNTAILLGSIVILFSIVASIISVKTVVSRNEEVYSRDVYFDAITRNVDDIFVVFDIERHKVEYVSENIHRIMGIAGKEYRESNNWSLKGYVDEATQERLEAFYENSVFGESAEIEYLFRNHTTGEVRLLRTTHHPIVEKDKPITRLISMTHDVTKDREIQNTLQDALNTAQEANDVKKDFLSRISHELRTPINAIIGMNAIADMSIGDDYKTRDCIKKIDVASKHLLGLVNDVLDMSKIESGKMHMDYALFDLDEVVENLNSMIYPRMLEKKQRLKIEKKAVKQRFLVGDEVRIRQIVLNFLTNAVKYTPEGGTITFGVSQNKDTEGIFTRFYVKDGGPGIGEDIKGRLFVPFEQGDARPAGSYGGAGLGLAISKNLATLMGGDIFYENLDGGGSEFSFDVRLYCPEIDGEGQKEEKDGDESYNFSGKRVLIVEDNDINMEITKELLTTVGFEVEEATDGDKAVEMFKNSMDGHYDLILMDIQMPVMNGNVAAQHIRKSGKADSGSVKIVAMTANALDEDISLYMNCGMNAHLKKPIIPKTMFAGIKSLLDK